MASFVVDGDKGGVGKSFVARAIADYLITSKTGGDVIVIDCDPSNADVAGGDGFHETETIGNIKVLGRSFPVSSQEDWFDAIDRASKLLTPGADYVFSLPAGAGLYIDDAVLSAFDLIEPVQTVWVMGSDQSSVEQFLDRIDRMPTFYKHGLIALNEHHGLIRRGAFDSWMQDQARTALVEGSAGGWKEFIVPPVNGFVMRLAGNMPLHRAIERSRAGEISPTVRFGIEAFRRIFGRNFRAALGKENG